MTTDAPDRADWRDRAACAGQDTNLWYGQPHKTRPAQATCRGCPVRAECLHDALIHEPPGGRRYGIRGGLHGRERNQLPALPEHTADAIAALRELLATTDEGTPDTVTTTPATPAAEAPEQLPVGRLLAWGDQHTDTDLHDQAARARAALTGLRQRYAADQELAAITTEADQLQQRLAALRARQAELEPPKPRRRRGPGVDYDAATVRAWARRQQRWLPGRRTPPEARRRRLARRHHRPGRDPRYRGRPPVSLSQLGAAFVYWTVIALTTGALTAVIGYRLKKTRPSGRPHGVPTAPLAGADRACGASTIGFFGTPLGPCALRRGHAGPMHQAANGAAWWPRADAVRDAEIQQLRAELAAAEQRAERAEAVIDGVRAVADRWTRYGISDLLKTAADTLRVIVDAPARSEEQP
ncbi:hypothetical protein BJP40_02630 [Streptomyces sp. CC53]|uniref:WhiB family transcriptional regulator n=1 Tax=Streptomyces sp. CC53 TaxID=1906740 RepID=UPI0008DE8169|nr:WhiB family transcriptional regulator [Streptomyces sp. CC53]OII63794.1 hypothetical protein BJP40_02630 [Streptomyces sp. CC53]